MSAIPVQVLAVLGGAHLPVMLLSPTTPAYPERDAMKIVLNKIAYMHTGGSASVSLSVAADDGEAGSVAEILVTLSIEAIKPMNYHQIIDAALAEAAKRHGWIEKSILPEASVE